MSVSAFERVDDGNNPQVELLPGVELYVEGPESPEHLEERAKAFYDAVGDIAPTPIMPGAPHHYHGIHLVNELKSEGRLDDAQAVDTAELFTRGFAVALRENPNTSSSTSLAHAVAEMNWAASKVATADYAMPIWGTAGERLAAEIEAERVVAGLPPQEQTEQA